MQKTIALFFILALQIFNFGCLGVEKTPVFISSVNIKINKWGYHQKALPVLPNGFWSRSEIGYAYLDSDGRLAIQADVSGNEEMEVLRAVTGRKGAFGVTSSLQIWDAAGNQLKSIQPSGYLTFLRAFNVDKDPKQELILYSYPNQNRGGTIEIVKADGTILNIWDNHFQGYFDVIDWRGAPHILSIEQNAFVILTLKGERVVRLDAPHAHYFRWITGKRLYDGTLIVLVSGSGYRPYSMICGYDTEHQLIFQEVSAGHANGLLVAPEYPDQFFVSHGKNYMSYRPTSRPHE